MATSLKRPHFVGPVPNELAVKGVRGQYSQMFSDQWTIKVSTGDNVFVIADDICLIVNIVDCHDGITVMQKCVLLLHRRGFVSVPILHSLNKFCR